MKFFDSQSEASIQWFFKLTLAKNKGHQVKGYGKLCQKLFLFLCTILFEVTWLFCKMWQGSSKDWKPTKLNTCGCPRPHIAHWSMKNKGGPKFPWCSLWTILSVFLHTHLVVFPLLGEHLLRVEDASAASRTALWLAFSIESNTSC